MRKALFEAHHIGQRAGLLNLPPAGPGAEGDVLLAADCNYGHLRAAAQGGQHLRFHALVHGQPLVAHDKVAVVAHPLRLVLAHACLQERGIVVNAELAGGADDCARVQHVVVGEGVLDPRAEGDACGVGCPAEAAVAVVRGRVGWRTGGGVDQLGG